MLCFMKTTVNIYALMREEQIIIYVSSLKLIGLQIGVISILQKRCLDDNEEWETLDIQSECSYMNGSCLTHLFEVQDLSLKIISHCQIEVNWENLVR